VFSPLDGHLVRLVHDLLCRTHPDVALSRNPLRGHHVVQRDQEQGVWLTVRLDERMRSHSPDQLIHLGDRNWQMSFDASVDADPEARQRQFIHELRAVSADDLSVVIVSDCDPPIEPAIVRSSPNKFAVRASTLEIAECLRRKILEERVFATDPLAMSELREQTIENPMVHVRFSIHDGSIRRALAKMALNTVCLTLGSDVARDGAFDAVRRFAFEGHEDDGEVVSLVEAEATQLRYAATLMCPPNHHAVRIEAAPDGMKALLVLYQRPIAIIQLTTVTWSDTFVMALFNYKRGATPLIYRQRYLAPLPGDKEWSELSGIF